MTHILRCVGVLLVVASLSKLATFSATSAWLSAAFGVSAVMGHAVCLLLILAELVIGLFASGYPVAAAPHLLFLSSIFCGFHAANIWQGFWADCPCFGAIAGENNLLLNWFVGVIAVMMLISSFVLTLKGLRPCHNQPSPS